MQLPIPDDWDGLNWQCVQVQWPDSPKWLALLAGALLMPTKGRFWDGETGIITSAQFVGREIDARNFPFTACDGSEIDSGEIETIYRLLADDSEEEMAPLCGYNPKAFGTKGGKLYVRDFCGDWVEIGEIDAVSGGGDVDLPPDVDTDLTDIFPCGMAAALAAAIVDLGGFIWDNADSTFPLFMVKKTENHMNLDLDNLSVINAVSQALVMKGSVIISGTVIDLERSDVIPSDWEELLACTFYNFMHADGTCDSDELWSAFETIIKTRFPYAESGNNLFIQNYWFRIQECLGKTNFHDISTSGALNDAGDCLCPGGEPAYTGSIQFLGTFFSITHPTWVSVSEVENNGKRLHIVWNAPAGAFQSDATMRPEVTFNGVPHMNFKVLSYPAPGSDFPKKDWYDTGCETGNPATTWTQEQFGATFNETYSTPAPGQRLTTAVSSDASPHGFTNFEFFVRKCNEIPGGEPEQPAITYDFYLEIVEIDGVPV